MEQVGRGPALEAARDRVRQGRHAGRGPPESLRDECRGFLLGGDELLHHAEETLGIKEGATTPDGLFSLEGYECQAACTEAPCLQVNYRYFHNVTTADFDRLVDDLRAGRRSDEIPPHGTLARTRQQIPADRAAGPADPAGAGPPVWLRDEPALRADA